MAENSWQQFVQTGRVADYLKYKEEERQEGHEQYHQRVSDTGADHLVELLLASAEIPAIAEHTVVRPVSGNSTNS